jgi:hypothetical protein
MVDLLKKADGVPSPCKQQSLHVSLSHRYSSLVWLEPVDSELQETEVQQLPVQHEPRRFL